MTDAAHLELEEPPYYAWSPITARPPLRWPSGARIAFAVVVTVEQLRWYPPAGTLIPSAIARNRPGVYPNIPDLHNISQFEYGNRVGVFRVLDVLQRYGVRPTIAIDSALAERAPQLLAALQATNGEFVGHGVSADQMISDVMSEADESAIITESLTTMRRLTSAPIVGWLGSEYSESSRTLELLAAEGIEYTLDWPTDEQPHPMTVRSGVMTNLPVTIELDDVFAFANHALTMTHWRDISLRQFDRLYREGADSGLLYVLNIHPWLTGQPYRIKYLEEIIAHVLDHPDVWSATGSEIVSAFRTGSA